MKLAMFVPCEKLIISADGSASVIVILQNCKVSATNNQPIPPDAIAPKDWVLVSMWQVPQDKIGKDFVQHFQILLPNGTEFMKRTLNFRPVKPNTHMNYLRLNALPIGHVGYLKMKSWVEEKDVIVSDEEEYLIGIEHDLTPIDPQLLHVPVHE